MGDTGSNFEDLYTDRLGCEHDERVTLIDPSDRELAIPSSKARMRCTAVATGSALCTAVHTNTTA